MDQETKDIMQFVVVSMVQNKPADPIPHLYSFLQEVNAGVPPKDAQPITDNELNEVTNLQKKIEYLAECILEKEQQYQ